MKGKLIVSLIAVAIGAVIIIVGLPFMEQFFFISGIGLTIYCTASIIAAYVAGSPLFRFFSWQRDANASVFNGCLLLPIYMCGYPIVGGILCLIGWVFAIGKLSELSKGNSDTEDHDKT